MYNHGFFYCFILYLKNLLKLGGIWKIFSVFLFYFSILFEFINNNENYFCQQSLAFSRNNCDAKKKFSGFPRGLVHTTPDEFDNGVFTLKTNQMFSVHTTPDEVDNGVFTLKTHQMFSVHTTPDEVYNRVFTLKTHQMFSVHTTPDKVDNGVFTLKTHQMFSVHTTPDKVDNGVFTLKTHQMFSVHTTPDEVDNGVFTLENTSNVFRSHYTT